MIGRFVSIFFIALVLCSGTAHAQFYGSPSSSGGAGYGGLVAAPKNNTQQPSYYPREQKRQGPVDFSNLSGQNRKPDPANPNMPQDQSASVGNDGGFAAPVTQELTPLEKREMREAELRKNAAQLQQSIAFQQQQKFAELNARMDEYRKKMLKDVEDESPVPSTPEKR